MRAALTRLALRAGLTAIVVAGTIAGTWSGVALALPEEPVVVPRGDLQAVYTSDYVNGTLISQGRATSVTKPFLDGRSVEEVRTSQTEYWVRSYSYNPDGLKGGAVGSWLMRASSIRGMTPEQVRDFYALPSLPTNLTSVTVPAGTVVWTGTSGPISGWGGGGGQQMFLTGRISIDNYIYQRAIGANALWYAPYLSNDARFVGSYLDHLPRVTPYSDLEYVYNMLDYLSPTPLTEAMNRISPARYDALTQLAMQDSLLFQGGLSQRGRELREDGQGGAFSQTVDGFNLWGRVLGSVGWKEASTYRYGWRYQSYGLMLGLDRRTSDCLTVGVSLGVIANEFSWDDSAGDGKSATPYLGVYLGSSSDVGYLETAMSAGYRHSDVDRRISFSGVDRVANSGPEGYDGNLRLGGGLNYKVAGWNVQPLLQTDLLLYRQSAFSEGGANSLNMEVQSWDAITFRGETGVRVSREMESSAGWKVKPQVKLGWSYTAPLDNREILANLSGQPGSFGVQGDTLAAQGIVPGLGLSLQTPGGAKLYADYESELREDLQSHSLSVGFMSLF
jgi:outer membrane autotransporter protein